MGESVRGPLAGQGQEPARGAGPPESLTTGLALHLQANVDSLVDKINDPAEVILTELARGQRWSPWEGEEKKTDT